MSGAHKRESHRRGESKDICRGVLLDGHFLFVLLPTQVIVAPTSIEGETPPLGEKVLVKVEENLDLEEAALFVLMNAAEKEEGPFSEKVLLEKVSLECEPQEGARLLKEEAQSPSPVAMALEGNPPKGKKPKVLELPSLPMQEKVNAAVNSLLAPGGTGSSLTPTTVISSHALVRPCLAPCPTANISFFGHAVNGPV